MDRRKLLAGGALAFGLLVIGYAVLSPEDDEERIVATVRDLAAAVSFLEPIENPVFFGSRLSGEFEDLLAEQVLISVPEVAGRIPRERNKLAMAAAQVLTRYGSLDVSLGDLEVTVGDPATVTGTATVTAVDGGTLRRDDRPIRFELVEDGGDWVVTRVVVRTAR